MKLYLSSYRIPTVWEFGEVLGKDFRETSVAIIPNAKDYREDRDLKLKELAKDLGEIGLHKTEQVDLNGYDEPAKLKEDLSGFDVLYVCGGNTTDLLFAVRTSGFHQIIRDVLNQGVMYVGESAGAMIAGKTIEGSQSDSDPPTVVQQYTAGLKLVDGIIVPHADSPKYNDRVPKLKAMYKEDNLIILNDNQAYVVNNDEGRIVTGGNRE